MTLHTRFNLVRAISLGIVISGYFTFAFLESKQYVFDFTTSSIFTAERPTSSDYITSIKELPQQLQTNPRWGHQLAVSLIYSVFSVLIVYLWFYNRRYTLLAILFYFALGGAILFLFILGLSLDSHQLAYVAPRMLKNALLTTPFVPFFLVAVGTFFNLRK